jgi:hypothetical protein
MYAYARGLSILFLASTVQVQICLVFLLHTFKKRSVLCFSLKRSKSKYTIIAIFSLTRSSKLNLFK